MIIPIIITIKPTVGHWSNDQIGFFRYVKTERERERRKGDLLFFYVPLLSLFGDFGRSQQVIKVPSVMELARPHTSAGIRAWSLFLF